MQYLPALLQRKECAIPQTVLEWNSGMEMLLTASTAEGVLTAWTIQPLLAKTQIMLHTSGITCLSELVGVRGAGASHVLSAGHDGNLVVWGGETGCEDIITTVRAHEKGVYTTSQSETLVFTAGIYTVPMESSPDILVWKKDHHDGLSDRLHKRLEGHRRQVVGLSVADSLGHLISGDSGGKITVWSLPGLVKLQELGNRRKSVGSRLEGRLSHFALLPPLNGRSPMLVTAGHKRGLEFYVWTAKRLHEPLVCASYSSRMECFVTVSSRRIMRWDARTGMPVVTFEAGSLLGDPNIDITSFCIDSTGTRVSFRVEREFRVTYS
jgi:WD40 repeat protein